MPGVDSEALSALHAAIAAEDLKAVRKIISSGLDVNDLHFREGWPLSYAVEVGNPKVVEALLKAGADPNKEDLMRLCIEQDKPKVSAVLIEHGIDLNGLPTWEKDDDAYETSLIRAVRSNRVKIVEQLVKAGADPNRHDGNDESALLVARMDNNKKLVKLLEPVVSSEERAWVNERFSAEYKAAVELDRSIESAIKRGSLQEVIDLFERSGRDVNRWLRPEGDYPLATAQTTYYHTRGEIRDGRLGLEPVLAGQHQIMHWLLDRGARGDLGIVAPLYYISSDDAELFQKILSSSRNLELGTMDGQTPLMGAAVRCDLPKLQKLVAAGAGVNARDRTGKTALGLLYEIGFPYTSVPDEVKQECVQFLLVHNAVT